MSLTTTSRRGKADLSRGAVVRRALALADEEGLDAVTIRRLAADFGVTPMALYWHVENKDELLAAMGDAFFDGIVERIPRTGRWDEQMHGIVMVLVQTLREHPTSAELAMPRALACDDGRELAEHALDLLRRAGFGVVDAAEIARRALQTAISLVTQQAGEEYQSPADERDEIRVAKRAALAGLSEDRFPRLVEAADALTNCLDEDAYFDFGVDMFVAGVRALRRRR